METLTKKDLVILTACTGEMFTPDITEVLNYCKEKLHTELSIDSMAISEVFEQVRELSKVELKEIVQKMNRQAGNL